MESKLYLKYRPTQLDDMVGQKNVVATLKQATIHNNFAHAYLFAGERGCGKTSSARILATLMTCENLDGYKVCGKCNACKTITNGSAQDVFELDGASNRGIDDIKKIIESSQWHPNELKKKIYIVDECHMLTKEATSALLKTLEEPPSYAKFILCTTDTHKILPTILSRCQRFNFTKIATKDLAARLDYIAKQESIVIDQAATMIIAKMARGSLRDGISYLEQIGTVGNGKSINEKNLQSYFGVVDRLAILQIIRSIFEGNISLLLDQINDMIVASADIKSILFDISDTLRNIMIMKIKKNDNKLIDLPDSDIHELSKIGENVNISQLIKLSQEFSNIDKKLDYNINERWIAESTLIKCVAILRK